MADSSPSKTESQLTIAANAVSDQPACADNLGFGPYVEAITAFLISEATQPPLTMSIEGEWGSGKSSFMLQLEKAIKKPSKRDILMQELPRSLGGLNEHGSIWNAFWSALRHRQRITIQFNAWRHDKQDALWAAFALTFTKNLRKQVGRFRAWKGDLSLFCRRLKGLRGWTELLLILFWVACLWIGLRGLYNFVNVHSPAQIHQFVSSLSEDPHKESQESKQNHEPQHLNATYEFLISHGKWGAFLLLFGLGFMKWRELKIPLSMNLKKYLSRPDYEGHLAFIENFHEDFSRLIKAYANDQRVFIFIDDLDRCDVPRAAELMQAINLMIGDAGKLVFILGMDREKVAAGITQKYKDLLPFISDFASSASNPRRQSGALYFGYSYLEKFIQLSFTLPVISDSKLLMYFLLNINKRSSQTTWRNRIAEFWYSAMKRKSNSLSTPVEAEISTAVNTSGTADANSIPNEKARQKRIRYLRVKAEKDSQRILEIVSMVCPIFENNPRKIKQFINTFRLSLFLASSQGALDQDDVIHDEKSSTEDEVRNVTPEQLAKFIALTLRFPDLRSELSHSENTEFLGKLEGAALGINISDYAHWLNQPGVKQVLLYGLPESGFKTYSLKNFPYRKLVSILPPTPAVEADSKDSELVNPTAYVPNSEKLISEFEQLAKRYEEIRRVEEAGSSRTIHMTELFNEARSKASNIDMSLLQEIGALFISADKPGKRLILISMARAHPAKRWIAWLLNVLDKYKSPFEHYNCIVTLLEYQSLLSGDDYKFILETLKRRWKNIQKDPGRIREAEALRDLAQQRIMGAQAAAGKA